MMYICNYIYNDLSRTSDKNPMAFVACFTKQWMMEQARLFTSPAEVKNT